MDGIFTVTVIIITVIMTIMTVVIVITIPIQEALKLTTPHKVKHIRHLGDSIMTKPMAIWELLKTTSGIWAGITLIKGRQVALGSLSLSVEL